MPEYEENTTVTLPRVAASRVVFESAGADNCSWECEFDGSEMTIECGSLSLTIDWDNEDTWVDEAKRLVQYLAVWNAGKPR